MATRYPYTLATRDAVQLAAEVAALGLPGYLDTQTQVDTALVQILFAADLTAPQKATLDAAVAAHTPDPQGAVKRLRAAAKAILAALTSEQADILRAVVLAVVDEINAIRQRLRAQDAAVAAAASLADLKARWSALAAMPDRTGAQARTAIGGHIDDGSADF